MNDLPWYLRGFLLLLTIVAAIPFTIRGEYFEVVVIIVFGWGMTYFYPTKKED